MHPTHKGCAIAAVFRASLSRLKAAVVYPVNYRSGPAMLGGRGAASSDKQGGSHQSTSTTQVHQSVSHQLEIAVLIGSKLNRAGYLSHLYVFARDQQVQDA
jgi:hypothetical protein